LLTHPWVGLQCVLAYAVDVGATIEAEADDILSEAWDAIKATGRDQAGM
jgi:hypothetical protein